MEQLEQLLIDRAGLTQEQAVKAIETIKDYIQSQLPPMMHGMVDNFLKSDSDNNDITMPGGN
jgi:hypothetical protein